mgnify:FL=1
MLNAQETKIQVGDIFETKNYGKLVVLEYRGHLDVIVKFEDTGYETTTRANELRKGEVRDRSLPSVCGVGIIGNGIARVCGVETRDYQLWKSMLCRCYDEKYSNKYPTYKDCEVSDNFKYFPYFKDWCSKQTWFGKEGWQLDKDILVKGNKVYSEDTCCFVPKDLNSLLTHRKKDKGLYPVGVSYKPRINRYIAQIRKFKENIHLGCFATPDEAFCAYKEAKEAYIKEVAELYKDRIDPRVYEALMNYVVEITD